MKARRLFAASARASVSGAGERGLIALIRGWLGRATPAGAPAGIGDDCAV